jgi:hypothetical protein
MDKSIGLPCLAPISLGFEYEPLLAVSRGSVVKQHLVVRVGDAGEGAMYDE